jgi:signal peptide peptidase SppA
MDITEEAVHEFQALMQDPAARQAFVEMKAQQAQQGAGRRYEHVLRVVGSRAWALEESMLALIVDVLAFRAYGGRLTADELDGRLAGARRTVTTSAPQGVARIPISGVIVPKASAFGDISGGTSVESMRDQLNQAVASPQVGSIILDVDSPGGMVDGIPELAADIRDARKQKPVIAVANTEAMSAAYWLASQADRFFASPSARVGSIGVLSTHEDRSVKAEHDGIKTTIIHAGKFKAEGSPFAPLSEGAKAHLQALVDSMYAMFLKDVSLGRGVKASAVEDNFGQGRFFDAQGALDRGMIDGIATIDEVIAGEFENIRKGVKTTAVNPTPAQMAALDMALQPRATPTVNVRSTGTSSRTKRRTKRRMWATTTCWRRNTRAAAMLPPSLKLIPFPIPSDTKSRLTSAKTTNSKRSSPQRPGSTSPTSPQGPRSIRPLEHHKPEPAEATPPAPDNPKPPTTRTTWSLWPSSSRLESPPSWTNRLGTETRRWGSAVRLPTTVRFAQVSAVSGSRISGNTGPSRTTTSARVRTQTAFVPPSAESPRPTTSLTKPQPRRTSTLTCARSTRVNRRGVWDTAARSAKWRSWRTKSSYCPCNGSQDR